MQNIISRKGKTKQQAAPKWIHTHIKTKDDAQETEIDRAYLLPYE